MAHIIEIQDFNAPELNVYARLSEKQLLNRDNPAEAMFIAESPKVIERALDAGYLPVSMLMETKHVNTQAKEILARCGDVPVYVADFDVLTQLTGFQLTRGMLCAMYRHDLPSVEEVCAGKQRIAVLALGDNDVQPDRMPGDRHRRRPLPPLRGGTMALPPGHHRHHGRLHNLLRLRPRRRQIS